MLKEGLDQFIQVLSQVLDGVMGSGPVKFFHNKLRNLIFMNKGGGVVKKFLLQIV